MPPTDQQDGHVAVDESLAPRQVPTDDEDQEVEHLSQPPNPRPETLTPIPEDEIMEDDDLPDDIHSTVSTRAPTSVVARQAPAGSTLGLLPVRRELESGEAPSGSRQRTSALSSASSSSSHVLGSAAHHKASHVLGASVVLAVSMITIIPVIL